MASGRGIVLQAFCLAALFACATANLSPQQQFQQQQLVKQQQALHCETIRLQNQATALHSLPACGGFADFDFANFTSTKAEFGNFCAWYCSVHQGVVHWQEKAFYATNFGKRCAAPVDTDLDVIAAYWCTTAADGSYCFKNLFSDAVKGVPNCAAIRSLDTQCTYQLKEALDIFASPSLRQGFQKYFNQCNVAYPLSAPAPIPLAGAKVPPSPAFSEPAVNFVSGGQTCPDGSAPLACTELDCARSSCPRYPGSQCVADQCDKCLPKYNEQVGVPGDLFGWGVNCTCPDGSLPQTCSPSPCSLLTCPAFPNAYCLVDTCYGCNAVFMVNGTEVDCGVQTKFPGANATVPVATIAAQTIPASLGAASLPKSGKAVSGTTSYAPPAQPAVVNPFAAGQTCPNGQAPPVTPPASACNASVCSQPLCGRYPTAQCVADECDGCKAKYNLNVGLPNDNVGWEVTASCPCPDGSAPFTKATGHPCIPDPCAFLKCQNFPTAFCVSDLCGGCNAVFLVNGQEVDCGNQVRFPGNVTGTSTIQATVSPTVPVITSALAPSPASANSSDVLARTASLVAALQQGNLTAILPLVTNTSILYAPNLPGPLGYGNVTVLAPFLSAVKGNVSSPVLKSFFQVDPTSVLVTEEFPANALGNMYATLLWVYTNRTVNSSAASSSSNWQLQYAALTPAPNGTVS